MDFCGFINILDTKVWLTLNRYYPQVTVKCVPGLGDEGQQEASLPEHVQGPNGLCAGYKCSGGCWLCKSKPGSGHLVALFLVTTHS